MFVCSRAKYTLDLSYLQPALRPEYSYVYPQTTGMDIYENRKHEWCSMKGKDAIKIKAK